MKTSTTSIGPLIRQHRKAERLSLRELADKTGLSASFLSQVETSKCQLSVQSLQQIAAVLKVPIHQLLYGADEQESQGEEQQKEIFFVSGGNCPSIFLPERNVISQLRTPNLGRGLEVLCSTGYRSSGNTARTLHVQKQEVIYLISGQVRIVIEEREHLLREGDSLYFRDLELQVFECLSETATWLSIISHH
jgi:transcriptional regulator with XRE-family HTH domain